MEEGPRRSQNQKTIWGLGWSIRQSVKIIQSFWKNYPESQAELAEPVESEYKPLDLGEEVGFGVKDWSQTVELAKQEELFRPKGKLTDKFEAERGGFGAESAKEPVESGQE